MNESREFAETHARSLSYALARTVAGLLLVKHADWSIASNDDLFAVSSASRWCERDLARLENGEGPVPSPMLIG